MKEFKSLKFIDKFKSVYTKFGVDYDIMRSIVKIKLTMDRRKVPTVFNRQKNSDKEESKMESSIVLNGFMGIILALFIGFKINILWQMTVYFFMLMFFVLTIFMSDFSTVLLDVRDKILIGTRGVDSRTLNAAKLTHILIYMFSLTLSLTGVSILVSLRYGVFFTLVFLLEIICIDIFMIIITTFVYFLVLKFFDGEKLKDMINFVQIILSIFITLFSQLAGRIFDVVDIQVNFTSKLWHYFVIPMWFASPLTMIESGEIKGYLIAHTLLAIIIPIVSIIIYWQLTPKFEEYLEKLNNNTCKSKKEKEKFSFRISRIICRNRQERIFFNFSYNLFSSEREIKFRIYPSLGLALAFPLIMIFPASHENMVKGFAQWKTSMNNSKTYLLIYFAVMLLCTVATNIKYSQKFQGSWVYITSPVDEISNIFKGCFKAIFYKFIFPIFILLSILWVFIFGIKVIPQLIIVFLVIIILNLFSFYLMDKALPFSESDKSIKAEGDVAPYLLGSILTGIFGGVHAVFIFFWPIGVYIYGAVLILIIILSWRKIFNIPLEKLMK
ncbi:ABC transporter permease [Hathewaya limosa]|uniref:ABC transporter permease n=1 Tax=Hathewaya limosa TaxID=1536 RepID=A0ABU0JTR0_HATLI|nr:ABC transporter permease [Hathewaya limosa]MDQ0480449.1 hypothetical protein [Hathewaya limosa]